ncbi:MAG: hypothetical protein R2705_11790 [Ilumatobacteraceae bacterium]
MSDLNLPPSGDGAIPWSPPTPGTTWSPGDAPVGQPLPSPPVGPPPAPIEPDSGGRGKRIGAMVGAGALLAAGVFAVSRIAGGSSGGAASPEDAVQAMFDALEQEDALGALDVLLPGERRTFRQPMVDLMSELERLEVVSPDAALDGMSGIDLHFELDDFEVDEVDDDIADVAVFGTYRVSSDAGQLPIGDFLIEEGFDGERPDAASTEDGDFGPQGLVVTTVEHDGRWYVSLWYSVAEQLRGTSSLPTRDEAVVPQGGDSPEEIAAQFIQAMGDLDLELMLASLHPDEFEALQRYAPIFLDDAQRQLDDAGIQVKISELELRSSTSGDTGAVGIESFALELSGDGDRVVVDWDGECITWELTGSDESSGTGCAADAADSFTPDSDTSPEQGAAAFAKALQDTEIIRVATFEGDWYISLVGSARRNGECVGAARTRGSPGRDGQHRRGARLARFRRARGLDRRPLGRRLVDRRRVQRRRRVRHGNRRLDGQLQQQRRLDR